MSSGIFAVYPEEFEYFPVPLLHPLTDEGRRLLSMFIEASRNGGDVSMEDVIRKVEETL